MNDDLHHFTARLGIDEAQTLLLPSPFDYQHQALLCVPRNLPLPNQPGAARHLAAMLAADRGQRWSLLYVVHLARHDARSGGAVPRHHDATGAAAGRDQQRQLLQQFVSAGNALLVATSSFWRESMCAATRCRW